jgi:CRP-like cAMP-binding protein
MHVHTAVQNRFPKAVIKDRASRPLQPTQAFFGSAELSGVSIPYSKGNEIYGENEPAEYLYKVLTGAVCSFKILSDGRRQVGGFYFPGDIIGLEADADHQSSVEAVTDCTVSIIKRSTVLATAARDSDVGQKLWAHTARELTDARSHAALLVKSANERVAYFLLELARRLSASDIQLPMSRQDIADHLGLTIETVSRTFTQFRDDAAIELPTSRRVVIRNRLALGNLNS